MFNWPPILRMLYYGTTSKSQLTWYILWPDVTRFFPKNANHINYRCKKDKEVVKIVYFATRKAYLNETKNTDMQHHKLLTVLKACNVGVYQGMMEAFQMK